MKKVLAAATCAAVLLSSGCASIFGDNNKTVTVNSHPQNAEVFANNLPVGSTPAVVTVPSTWHPTTLTLKKKGYKDQTAQVETAFQPVGLLNILFWPGFIVDAISGDMMKIKPESKNINVNLAKKD